MTKYREILRLLSNKLKTDEIVQACRVSKKTVIKVKKRAAELGISWLFTPFQKGNGTASRGKRDRHRREIKPPEKGNLGAPIGG